MSELKQHMGLFQLTMYGVGLIFGAGISVYMGLQFELVVAVGIGIIVVGIIFYLLYVRKKWKPNKLIFL